MITGESDSVVDISELSILGFSCRAGLPCRGEPSIEGATEEATLRRRAIRKGQGWRTMFKQVSWFANNVV